MAEPKRLPFTTVVQTKDDKPRKKTPETVRLDLTLKPSTDTTCPEFFYTDLVKNDADVEKVNGDGGADNPFGDDEDHEKLAAIAKSFEQKYAPKPRKKGKRKHAGRLSDLVDLGDGYDDADPFIDNSEFYDEVIPLCLTTKLGGFYINSGRLDFKDVSDDSGDDFIFHKKKRKKRVIASDSESDGENQQKKKKKKLKEDIDGDKKKKLVNGKPEKSFKKPQNPLEKDKLPNKKKKTSPTVAELLKQQTSATSTPVMNGSSHDLELISPSSNDESSQDAQSYDERIDSVIDSVIAMAKDSDHNLESILDNPMGFKDDSNSKDGDKSMDAASAPKLPLNIPKDLENTIDKLKEAAKTSREGKCKFFTNEVNSMLLDVELGSRKLGSCSQRSSIYSHLAAFLPCAKDTLLKRAKKLQQSQQDDQLKEPIQKLREAINGMMPALQEKHELECQKFALQKQKDGVKEDQSNKEGNNDTEDSDEEKTSEASKKGAPKGPRRKFQWTESVRSLLCEIVRIKLKNFDLIKTKTQSAEEFLKGFLDREIKPLWPKGWMQTRTLFKECKAVHAQWTNPAKVKKPGTVITSKATPTNTAQSSQPTTSTSKVMPSTQTSSVAPKFVPGSTPVRPSNYDNTNKSVSKSQATKTEAPTLLDYAGKDNSALASWNPVSTVGSEVSSAASGLSLLASSAASQKYMDKSWDHVVSDILRNSLTTDKSQQKAPISSSFLDQFQSFANSVMQRQMSEEDSKQKIGEISPKKKQDLLLETKSQTQKQLLSKLMSASQKPKSETSPLYNKAQTFHTTPKQEVKIVRVAPPAHQNKPQTPQVSSLGHTSQGKRPSVSEDVYRKFLLENGIQIPQSYAKSQSNTPGISVISKTTSGNVVTMKLSSSGAKTDSIPPKIVVYSGSSSSNQRPSQSLYNTSIVPSQSSASIKKPSHMTVSPMSRTSPQQGQRSVNVSSVSPNNNSSPSSMKTSDLPHHLYGLSEGLKSPSHSQPKQISPSSHQASPISPSVSYSRTSPQHSISPQNAPWSVASMTGSHKPNPSSQFNQTPRLPKPVPGYQSLKLSNFPREGTPTGSLPLPPPVMSPVGMPYPPTSPLLPGTQNPLLRGNPGNSAGMYPPYTSSLHQSVPYNSQYSDKSRSPHGY